MMFLPMQVENYQGDFEIENDNFTAFLSYSSQRAKFNNGEALDLSLIHI